MSDFAPPSGPGAPTAFAEGFPSGPDLTLMMDFREFVRQRGKALGLREIGCGVGVGGADVQFALGDQSLFVRISIEG